MRVFAGPNGSGKSTFKTVLPEELQGVYLNPDEIQSEIETEGRINLTSRGISSSASEVKAFFENSSLFALAESSVFPGYDNGSLTFDGLLKKEYTAAATTDFLRNKLLDAGISFTFETVMSHRSKIELLTEAKEKGYRTYLYYIGTGDPQINVIRVRRRVNLGGHPVSERKITDRYYRSLELLMDAILNTDRAYVFDNSVDLPELEWLAEISNGTSLIMKVTEAPAWFKVYVLDKMNDHP